MHRLMNIEKYGGYGMRQKDGAENAPYGYFSRIRCSRQKDGAENAPYGYSAGCPAPAGIQPAKAGTPG
jgi:hypothetical protein